MKNYELDRAMLVVISLFIPAYCIGEDKPEKRCEILLSQAFESSISGQYTDAETCLNIILQGEYDNFAENNINTICEIIYACSRDGQHCINDPLSENLIGFFARNYTGKKLPYEALNRLFYGGNFQVLFKLAKMDIFDPCPRTLAIYAQSAGAALWSSKYKNSWTSHVAMKPHEIGKLCTEFYEEAIRLTPDQYTKTQLANDWLVLRSEPGFQSSDFIIQHLCLENIEPDAETLKKTSLQIKEFHEATLNALSLGKQSNIFSKDSQKSIALHLTKEYEYFARIGIPDDVFNKIIKDLPAFFDEGLPLFFIKELTEMNQLRCTLRWYLWYSVISPTPDRFEEQVMSEQISDYSEYARETIEKLEIPVEKKSIVLAYVDKWAAIYKSNKDLRFIPYFKKPYPPGQFEVIFNRFKIACNDQVNQLDRDIKVHERYNSQGALLTDRAFDISGFAILVLLNSNFLYYERPMKKYGCNEVYRQDFGTTNEYNIHTYFIHSGENICNSILLD